MHVLLFGKTGQVGRELQRRRPPDAVLEVHGRDVADFSNPGDCVAFLRKSRADVVINAAAYTAVDRAEEEEAVALLVNGEAPGALARAAADMNLPFIQISTDYVFDGAGTAPFRPDHPTAPLGAYGRSKLAGETAVRAAGGVHAIIRTSWVFSAHGTNFVKTMLRLAADHEQLNIVADQVGGPTPAAAIADLCLSAAQRLIREPGLSGTYHFSGAPDVSWADFARAIFALSGQKCQVVDIPSSGFPTAAPRPLNSRLDNTATEAAFGTPRPDWRTGLREILTELRALQT